MSLLRSWRDKRRAARLARELERIEWRREHSNDKCVRCKQPRYIHGTQQACSLFKGMYD